MSTEQTAAAAHRHLPVAVVVTLLTAIITVVMIGFAWPAARSAPRDVPLGLVGPPPAVAQVQGSLEHAIPGGFEITAQPDRAAAIQAIRARDIYGAIVLGPDGPEVLTASAAGPAVSQILSQASSRLAAQSPNSAKLTDIVPLSADDPRGAGLAAGALPLVLGGIVAAGLLSQLVKSGIQRVAGAAAFAITGSLSLTAVLQFWLGSLEGNYALNATVIALSIAAISLTLLGLEWLLGTPGLILGAATMMLLGNSLSGMSSAPEMLPSGWGALGRYLPPGATGTALRSESFFDGAAVGKPLLVLTCWIALGLALCGLGALRNRNRDVVGASGGAVPVSA
jgi:hypothetical protein